MKKISIAILAHPDDDAFGMGGTLALRASQGQEVHVILATKGEAGGKNGIESVREKEAQNAAKLLGLDLNNYHFLGFTDGQICNNQYHDIADKISAILNEVIGDEPAEVDLLTFDRYGISGHLDHIAMSMIATFVFRRSLSKMDQVTTARLLYLVSSKLSRPTPNDSYFVYGPAGVDEKSIDIISDVSSVFDKKVAAIKAHASQNPDFILRQGDLLKKELFVIYDGK